LVVVIACGEVSVAFTGSPDRNQDFNTPTRGFLSMEILVLVCEAIGTAATPGLLCQPRVIVKMIVEKQVESRLAGEPEVLGENLP
jgi:hypothetical protein